MFGRSKQRPEVAPAAELRTGRCAERACGSRGARACEYIDKRSRHCSSAWCDGHGRAVAQGWYCRRHASTVEALEGNEAVAGMPDLDNRAPSLAGWMGRELDRPVRDLLTRMAPVGATVVTDPVRLILTPGGSTRRWAKTWKLVDHASVVNRVAVEVDEGDDTQVSARVDSELIGRGVPPWIERRAAGLRPSAAVDGSERRRFTEAMARSIELVVTRQEVLPRY